MKLKVITPTSKASALEVSDMIFGQKMNQPLLSQAVRVYLTNLRQGTSKVKTRGEVNRTKAKWYRQKGTGNARHGSRNAPIFVGGGKAHGPNGTQNWQRSLSHKMKLQALRVALSAQVEQIVVTDNLNGLKGRTREASKLLKKMLGELKKTLIVLSDDTQLVARGLRNIQEVLLVNAKQLTALDVVSADQVVLTKESLQLLEKRLLAKKSVKSVKSTDMAKKSAPVKKAAVKPRKKS